MKKKKGVWIPTQDNWKGWSSDFEKAEYIKLNLNGDLAIDIGAHVGIWSQRLSKDFFEVICFEPLSKHIECHKMNCGELDNVTLIECALSDMEKRESTVFLSLSKIIISGDILTVGCGPDAMSLLS